MPSRSAVPHFLLHSLHCILTSVPTYPQPFNACRLYGLFDACAGCLCPTISPDATARCWNCLAWGRIANFDGSFCTTCAALYDRPELGGPDATKECFDCITNMDTVCVQELSCAQVGSPQVLHAFETFHALSSPYLHPRETCTSFTAPRQSGSLCLILHACFSRSPPLEPMWKTSWPAGHAWPSTDGTPGAPSGAVTPSRSPTTSAG